MSAIFVGDASGVSDRPTAPLIATPSKARGRRIHVGLGALILATATSVAGITTMLYQPHQVSEDVRSDLRAQISPPKQPIQLPPGRRAQTVVAEAEHAGDTRSPADMPRKLEEKDDVDARPPVSTVVQLAAGRHQPAKLERPYRIAPLEQPIRPPTKARLSQKCDRLEFEERARCMQPEVLTAYRELRRTYDEAVRASADTGSLRKLQRRWTRLERDTVYDPDERIDGYHDLGDELQDLLRDTRSNRNAQ